RFGKSVASGVTGIVTMPLSEIKESGSKGIFKGAAKGAIGFVAKPLSGMADAISTFSTSISDTLPAIEQRLRPTRFPRMFYGEEKSIKSYNADEAQITDILRKSQGGRHVGLNFVDYFFALDPISKDGNIKILVVVGSNKFLCVKDELNFKKEVFPANVAFFEWKSFAKICKRSVV
ncbi:Vacuolar protein sorting-associated protein 13, partial [Bonamia ostreae]